MFGTLKRTTSANRISPPPIPPGGCTDCPTGRSWHFVAHGGWPGRFVSEVVGMGGELERQSTGVGIERMEGEVV